MSVTTDNTLKILRINLPGAVDESIRLSMMEVVAELCRDALQITPPTDYTTNPETWMVDALWQEHHQTVYTGVLARKYAEAGKPYSSNELAASYLALYQQGLFRARQIQATKASATSYDRVMNNLRANVPGARDDQINQELFNTIDDLQRNILQATPPVGTVAPNTWLPATDYDKYFRLLVAGTLVRLLTQPGKPWSDTAIATVKQAEWMEQITIARAEVNAAEVQSPQQLLFENLRTQLPGSKDAQIKLELFNVIDEVCRDTLFWTQIFEIPLVTGTTLYSLIPTLGDIIEVLSIAHDSLDTSDALYDDGIGMLSISAKPTSADTDVPLFVTARMTPERIADYTRYLPDDLWAERHQMLLHGVLGRMMLQVSKPYSNPAMAQYHQRRFRKFMNEMQVTRQGNGRNWRFPRGGFISGVRRR